MNRTLTVVFDEISEFTNTYGTFYGVSGLFNDESLVKANKKSRVEAQELRDTLLQLVDIECDYYCDDDGKAQTGRQKWKLKAILDLEGGAIYGKVPQGVQGGGATSNIRPTAPPIVTPSGYVVGSAPLRTTSTPNKDDEIRAAVALKAAASIPGYETPDDVLRVAEKFEQWLKSKSSPAGTEYGDAAVPGSPAPPAGEPTSAVVESSSPPPSAPPTADPVGGGEGGRSGKASTSRPAPRNHGFGSDEEQDALNDPPRSKFSGDENPWAGMEVDQ